MSRVSSSRARPARRRTPKTRRKNHAWFVGFAPADHPRIVVAVLLELGGHGGHAAAPRVGDHGALPQGDPGVDPTDDGLNASRAQGNPRLSAGGRRAVAVGLRHPDGLFGRPDRRADRRRAAVQVADRLARRVARRRVRDQPRIRAVSGVGGVARVSADAGGARVAVRARAAAPGDAASSKSLADDRRSSHRPAVRAGEDHRRR